MAALDSLLARLGEEIVDASEETFLLFSNPIPSRNLGIIDDRAQTLDLTIASRDFTIKQNPTVLNSAREGGTTGAVVWKVTPRFAEWIASPQNLLFQHGLLDAQSTVLELGAGIAGIVPVLMGTMVGKYLATDQSYALKLLKENIDANSTVQPGPRKAPRRVKVEQSHNIQVASLDWEIDDVKSFLTSQGIDDGVDLVLACDCVYNYALIEPFVQCCADACRIRNDIEGESTSQSKTVCLVAQQLRQPDVFEEWLEAFHKRFRVWRVPEEALGKELREGSGFVVHLGVLREPI